jgi:hypothetical protein
MTRLILDIDFTSQPVRGTLGEKDGPRHRFVGWIGLSELLGRLGRIDQHRRVGGGTAPSGAVPTKESSN